MTPVIPVDFRQSENDFSSAIVAARLYQFISPDKSVLIPVKQDFINNDLYYRIKMHEVIRAFGLQAAAPGKPSYLTGESEETNCSVTIGEDGSISSPMLFAEQGGEGVVVDAQGNVYPATGEVFVYGPSGALIDTIRLPERPLQLLFGRSDGKMLYILTHTTLYSVRTRFSGR